MKSGNPQLGEEMQQLIEDQLLAWKFNEDVALALSIAAIIIGVLLVAILSNELTKRILLQGLHRVIKRSSAKWDDALKRKHFFRRLSHLAPAIVIYFSANLIVTKDWEGSQDLAEFIRRVALVAMVWIVFNAMESFLNGAVVIYHNLKVSQKKPIQSYAQVAKIFLAGMGAILAFSILMNKSPWAFLTGLGAISAVIILVFKDSILGFVASIQISAYDMVRMGDWIVMPKFGADGDVIDISLNTIKVRNWDKTISMIPTSSLLTESVQNWRGMFESGGRRIKRHINIDMNTIKFCDEEMIQRFSKIHYISEYTQKKIGEVQSYNQENKVDTSTLANGRHLTNVGTFRAYVESYLKNHPLISDELTFLIRQLQPTEVGLPMEIYVFAKDTRWVQYEAIQADIFDHILAVIPHFDLAVFQNTSGQNYKIDIVSMPKNQAG